MCLGMLMWVLNDSPKAKEAPRCRRPGQSEFQRMVSRSQLSGLGAAFQPLVFHWDSRDEVSQSMVLMGMLSCFLGWGYLGKVALCSTALKEPAWTPIVSLAWVGTRSLYTPSKLPQPAPENVSYFTGGLVELIN